MYSFANEVDSFPSDAENVVYFSVVEDATVSQIAYRGLNPIREQAPSDGAYFRESQLFFLPAGQSGQILPIMPGDTLTDVFTNIYKILSVSGGWKGSSYQVAVRRLGIQDLGRTVKYVRVSGDSSGTTARVVTEVLSDPILAAIQPQVRIVTDELGAKATPQTYHIWIAQTLGNAINAGDMFEDQDGTRFEILAVSDRRRIDELALFECIKKL